VLDKTAALNRNVTILLFFGLLLTLISGINNPPQESSMTKSEIDQSSARLKVADMVKSGRHQLEAIDRGAGIYENTGIGNSYLVTTPSGNVLVNAGTLRDARRGKSLFEKVSQKPITHIVLTQSHANQFGGLEIYKTPDNQIIAHRIYLEDRAYGKALNEHYRRGSRRIFGSITGATSDLEPTNEIPPDILIDTHYAFEVGNRRFELLWTPGGETRSALIVWLPHDRIAIVGNLFGPLFGNHPNLNTLRGDKPRSALEFVESVKILRALKPIQILTGHEDIRGEAHIHSELTRIADSVQWVHDRTIQGMNAGTDLRTLMAEIRTPEHLKLTEEYGKLSWNVRAIWHEYTGWYDVSKGITELFDTPQSSVAPTLVELSGGEAPLIEKAKAFIEQDEPLKALHLLDIMMAANPKSETGRHVRRDALMRLQTISATDNLWTRMSIAAELKELE